MSRTANIIVNILMSAAFAVSIWVVFTVLINSENNLAGIPAWMLSYFVPTFLIGGFAAIWLWVAATPKRG